MRILKCFTITKLPMSASFTIPDAQLQVFAGQTPFILLFLFILFNLLTLTLFIINLASRCRRGIFSEGIRSELFQGSSLAI